MIDERRQGKNAQCKEWKEREKEKEIDDGEMNVLNASKLW